MTHPSINNITSDQLDALREQAERGQKAEALLLHFAAEAHRRKWNHDLGLDDDGIPLPSPAFRALHQLGDDMSAALHKLRASKPTAKETAA